MASGLPNDHMSNEEGPKTVRVNPNRIVRVVGERSGYFNTKCVNCKFVDMFYLANMTKANTKCFDKALLRT